MILKQSQQKSWLRIGIKTIGHSRIKQLLVILLLTGLMFALGVYVDRAGYFDGELKLIIKNRTAFSRNIEATLFKPDVDRITIDIKHEDYMKLAYQRELALTRDILTAETKEFVPATIRFNGESVQVKIRLKGDWTDHLEGDKWSFRIKVKGDNTLFGMKQFSIHHPKTRNYIYEWLYHQALKREDVLALRYEFIAVTLNGKNLGLYALEEHFDKRLIEHNRRREGPIIRFNEDLLWAERFQQHQPFPEARINGNGTYLASDIDAFQTNQIAADPVSYAHYTQAMNLLESFRRGQLKPSEVFDVQILARYFAITDLMGAQHGTWWHNIRFYYNPVTSRLEPIGFDGNSGAKPLNTLSATKEGVLIGHASLPNQYKFEAMIFNDPIFFREYIKALERMSEPAYLDALLADLDDELEQKLDIIYSEFPYFDFSTESLYQNQRYIKTVLNPIKGLHAYFHRASKGQIELQLGNIQSLPLEVLSISYRDAVLFQPVQETVLPAKLSTKPVVYQNVSFGLPEDFVWSDAVIQELTVNYRILGAGQLRAEQVFPWPFLEDNFVGSDFIRQPANVEQFDFLVTDEAAREIFIKSGAWQVDRSVFIPAGYRVRAGAGTRLDLTDSATILSYSPLEFVGSEDEPIVIQSTDSSGQGLVVMNAGQASELDYVIFNNLSNPNQQAWELTGAVTFYASPVQISNSQFVANRSEDSLNIIRSEFTIDTSLFSQTLSDAFDGDFVEGRITDSVFVAPGNDAIDVSGSVLEIQNVFISGAGDKGLSAGENSQMAASRIEMEETAIAVASKDISEITLENVTISGGQIGLSAYQKKPEFGPASINATSLTMSGVEVPYLVEKQSTVIVDKQTIEPSREKVEDILYGVEYGKSSK